MPRRAPRFPIPLPRGAVKLLVVLNVAVAGLLGGWFVLQPETRQREVRRLVENAFEHHKRVSALDVAWDLWQLYYADSATGRIATGDNAIVSPASMTELPLPALPPVPSSAKGMVLTAR